MGKTNISIENESFLINGKLTYSEINTSKPQAHGLLMNGRFARWGHSEWNAEANTQALVDALPQWHGYGLRAFTVGFQGGAPCFTISNMTGLTSVLCQFI